VPCRNESEQVTAPLPTTGDVDVLSPAELPAFVAACAGLLAHAGMRMGITGGAPSSARPAVTAQRSQAPLRSARIVFARELLIIGPWRTMDALKKAHRRGVLREGAHWNWVGGMRAYYLDRLFPARAQDAIPTAGEEQDDAEATTRRLSRVLAELPPRQAASRMASRSAEAAMADGSAGHPGAAREVGEGPKRRRGPRRPGGRPAAAPHADGADGSDGARGADAGDDGPEDGT
jgi:hypothetical protein